MRQKFLTFLFIIFLIKSINCDLPVHCLKHQTIGEWTIFLSSPIDSKYVKCGHNLPDDPENSFLAYNKEFVSNRQYEIELTHDDEVIDLSNNKKNGYWSMVYDEGFDINFGSLNLFAFSRYFKDKNDWASDCSSTLVGWFHDKVYFYFFLC